MDLEDLEDLEDRPAVLDPDQPAPDRPLAVIPLFSGGASGARYCEEHDPRFGEAYRFPVAISSDPEAPGIDRLDTDVAVRDIHGFYADRDADITDMDVRRAYDRGLRELLDRYEPDVLMLSGYMYVVTDPLLRAYHAINVHPADLRITEDGTRKYTGMDAVYDAIVAGEAETRSSVHFLTAGVDAGPLLTVSPPAPVHTAMVDELDDEPLRTYADVHQEWMKDRCDGPAFVTALHRLADGRVALAEDGVRVDGTPGPTVMDTPTDEG